MSKIHFFFFFFFQAEDGIRDLTVTGVQTCALPIFRIAPVQRGQECSAEEVARDLHAGGAAIDAAERLRDLEAQLRISDCRIDRPRMDDAAERVGAVRDGARPARNFDRAEGEGIEKRSGSTSPALRGNADSVEENERAAAGEPTHHGHRGRTFAADLNAGGSYQRVGEMLRVSFLELLPSD